MSKYFSWIVRAVFGTCLVCVYFFACQTHAFKFKAQNFLFINLILAYVPVEMSLHMGKKTSAVLFWTLFPFWFFFYPNAPYMLTDFFHLAMFQPYITAPSGRLTSLLMPDIPMWAAYTVLSICILVAALFGVWSLDHVTDAIMARFKVKHRALANLSLVVGVSACAGAGIYLGRFPRLNTVDLFMHTRWAIGEIFGACGMKLLAFTVLMTLLQTTLWALFKIIRNQPQS